MKKLKIKKVKLSTRTKTIGAMTTCLATGTVVSMMGDQIEAKECEIICLKDSVDRIGGMLIDQYEKCCDLTQQLNDMELLSESICW